MTLRQRIDRAKSARQCFNCQSTHVGHLGTSILQEGPKLNEIEHRFRCRSCFFRWSEFV